MDHVDALTRSRIMRAVKNRRVKSTEMAMRARLAAAGIRGWRMYAAGLPGTPDFVFDKERLAIFVDGCFWHGCPRCYRRPQSNQTYWDAKVRINRSRDFRISRQLRREGWQVCRVWECQLHAKVGALAKVRRALSRGDYRAARPVNPAVVEIAKPACRCKLGSVSSLAARAANSQRVSRKEIIRCV